MTKLKSSPIRRKLMAIMLLVSAVVMMVTCACFFAYEFVTFRQRMVQTLSTLGEIVGANSTAALAFENHDDAREVLTALRAERHIVAAALYDKNGAPFATYPDTLDAAAFPKAPATDGYKFENSYLIGYEPVIQGGQRRGTLYLKSDMEAITERFRSYGEIALAVIVGSSLLGFFLARKLQNQISEPILRLAETAKAISDRRDFSVRATKVSADELGSLTEAFNQMLDRIQTQLARLDLLSHTTRAIGERQDLPSICQVVVRSLEDHLPIDFGCVCLYDASRQALKVISVGFKSQELAEKLAMQNQDIINIDENGLSRCVRGHLVYEPDILEIKSAFPQRLAKGGLRALVVAPLAVESNIFGVLIATRREPNSFDSADCEFLKQLSEHTALAAHQAQLYTALQQAYDDLRQTQLAVMEQERLRALGQMASGIAHDINNAISPIGLYTESLLENEPNLSARARDYLQTIQHAIEDVAQTVARMKEFYRRRETQLTLTPVALNQLMQQVVNLSRARWNDMPQQRGITVRLLQELDPNLPPIMGVESEIREALINLIFNGVDAMPDGGSLTLRTKTADGRVIVEVSDSGIGMNEETRRRCLEPFFTTKGERGTGLGLAMVYGAVQRHNAEIELDSELGKGTTVRLIFPIPAGQAAPATAAEAPRALPARSRILVVDDDPMLIKSLRDTLENDGHAVTTATGGQAGIDAFRAALKNSEPFGIVISDLGMPNVDGRKVAAAIKEASPRTPLILLTGWGQRLVTEGDIPEHVDRVLSKPPKLRELREALTQCLAAAHASKPS
ncbi:MAG TPA: ATP-binding protein [Verrucomicrobiae bacterium]|jgi:signal transduction histidine kinase/ActR/RegA family two-component response regulator|nr:ATP-binding protein [Verrucomicrobiae bacterium]